MKHYDPEEALRVGPVFIPLWIAEAVTVEEFHALWCSSLVRQVVHGVEYEDEAQGLLDAAVWLQEEFDAEFEHLTMEGSGTPAHRHLEPEEDGLGSFSPSSLAQKRSEHFWSGVQGVPPERGLSPIESKFITIVHILKGQVPPTIFNDAVLWAQKKCPKAVEGFQAFIEEHLAGRPGVAIA